MTNSSDKPIFKNDIYWKLLDDCIQRLGELSITDEILLPNDNTLVEDWDTVRAWRATNLDPKYHLKLIEVYQSKVLAEEVRVGFDVNELDEFLKEHINSGMRDSDYQKLLERCVHSLGMQKLSYWSLIKWADISNWYQKGVPESARESVMGLQEVIISGLEKEILAHSNGNSEKEEPIVHTKVDEDQSTQSVKPQLKLYRDAYSSFYEDILTQDVHAIFEAEEEMVNSNLRIGQQIYRVRAILAVYSQRKFLEWLKGICCKICNISWRKAYDLMYAYESRRYIERNQPDLLSIFDFQLQRFQCEARRYITDLIPILEEAKDDSKRFTLEEVKEMFPPEKVRPPEDAYVSELRMSLKKLLDASVVSDLSSYLKTHPSETFQSILDVALRNWLHQYA